MKLFQLLAVFAVTVVLSAINTLGIFLLLLWVKGKQIHFDSELWDAWFLTLTEKKATQIIVCVALIALTIATIVSYWMLNLFGFQEALAISATIFAIRAVTFWIRYKNCQKNDIAIKLEKLKKSIQSHK